uniref:Chorion class high-cysteine HCB protein 13 n=1 Tax=Bombyx mori TaxID=7091 RepID=A0A8R2M1L9_BOMMO|nr:uncharacterized protein LOC119629598 isoform X2 [Bombyx mori]
MGAVLWICLVFAVNMLLARAQYICNCGPESVGCQPYPIVVRSNKNNNGLKQLLPILLLLLFDGGFGGLGGYGCSGGCGNRDCGGCCGNTIPIAYPIPVNNQMFWY